MGSVRLLSALLLLGLSLTSLEVADAKTRRDSGCYDRCDRGLLSCQTDASICAQNRRSCILSCDPSPSHPGAVTLKRLDESDDQIHRRLSAKPAGKLSSCQVHCEDSAEACAAVNSASVCSEGREACFQRCKAGKPR